MIQFLWSMHICFPFCLRRTLSRPGHLLRCLRNIRLGGDLTSLVPSIKGHQVMTLNIVSLWRSKSRIWLRPTFYLSRVRLQLCKQLSGRNLSTWCNTTRSWYVMSTFGIFSFNWADVYVPSTTHCFQILCLVVVFCFSKILSSRPRWKSTCVGLLLYVLSSSIKSLFDPDFVFIFCFF